MTGEEWRTLQFAPFWVFSLVAGSDDQIDRRELGALLRAVCAPDHDGQLVRDVMESVAKDFDRLVTDYGRDERTVDAGLAQVSRLLDGKAASRQALAFKSALAQLAHHVARASHEGRIGRGSVSDEETAALVSVSAMLGLSPESTEAAITGVDGGRATHSSSVRKLGAQLAKASLHAHPPLTPAGVLLEKPVLVPVLFAVFVFLAIGAAVSGGELLLTWDEPVQTWVEGARTPWLDTVMKAVTWLGDTATVVGGFTVLLLLVWRRCRSLALILLVATLTRPLLEWLLKVLVDRPRPDLERLVHGEGPSFPSGHPMAAVALWGLLPPLVALFTHKRFLWWCSATVSLLVITLVAASRVYLGVHWLSDVVGALVLGSLYLVAVEWLLEWHHDRASCQAFMVTGHDLRHVLAKSGDTPGPGGG